MVVDQYGGRVFDDYEEADEFAQAIGYPTLMGLAAEAVAALSDGFIAAGFSNGGGMAEFVATKRLDPRGLRVLCYRGRTRWGSTCRERNVNRGRSADGR